MSQTLQLLDQIVEIAKAKDAAWKEIHKRLHKASQSVGEDSLVFHLERLRELIVESQKPLQVVQNPFSFQPRDGVLSPCRT